MKRIVKLTERDLKNIVKRTLNETATEAGIKAGEGPLDVEAAAKLEAKEGWFSDVFDKAKQAKAKELTAKGVKPMAGASALKKMANLITPEIRAKMKEAMLKKIAEMKPCEKGNSGTYTVLEDKVYLYNKETKVGCRID